MLFSLSKVEVELKCEIDGHLQGLTIIRKGLSDIASNGENVIYSEDKGGSAVVKVTFYRLSRHIRSQLLP